MLLVANPSVENIGTSECPHVRIQMNEIVRSTSSKSTNGTTTSKVPNVPTLANNEM
jgi:hypothetical protein